MLYLVLPARVRIRVGIGVRVPVRLGVWVSAPLANEPVAVAEPPEAAVVEAVGKVRAADVTGGAIAETRVRVRISQRQRSNQGQKHQEELSNEKNTKNTSKMSSIVFFGGGISKILFSFCKTNNATITIYLHGDLVLSFFWSKSTWFDLGHSGPYIPKAIPWLRRLRLSSRQATPQIFTESS